MTKKTFNDISITRWEDLPDFELYIDQVVNLIEKNLSFLKLDENDKLITNTMINNYVKSSIVQAPIKKKYTREHVAYFIVICLLKKVYSLDEISKLIKIQFENSPIDHAYNSFVSAFELMLKGGQYEYDQDNEVLDLFYKTIQSVVYCIFVSNELFYVKTINETKKENK